MELSTRIAFGTPKFYIAPYGKIKHGLVSLSSNYDVKSGPSRIFFLPLLQCEGTIMTSFLLFGRHACPAGSVFGERETAFAFTGANSFLRGFSWVGGGIEI